MVEATLLIPIQTFHIRNHQRFMARWEGVNWDWLEGSRRVVSEYVCSFMLKCDINWVERKNWDKEIRTGACRDSWWSFRLG